MIPGDARRGMYVRALGLGRDGSRYGVGPVLWIVDIANDTVRVAEVGPYGDTFSGYPARYESYHVGNLRPATKAELKRLHIEAAS